MWNTIKINCKSKFIMLLIMILIALLVASLFMFSKNVYADSYISYVNYNAHTLVDSYILKNPSLDSDIIVTLSPDISVQVVNELENGFCKVKYGDKIGYMYKLFLEENLDINNKVSNKVLKSNDEITSYEIEDFKCILQYPELPTGCEITSLTMVLNYLGYEIDKCTLADNYLNQGGYNVGPFYSFVGNPRLTNGMGCYSAVIEKAAQTFKYNNNYTFDIKNLSYSKFDDLLDLVKLGKPIIIWTTMELSPSYISNTWVVNGLTMHFKSNEHCVVLIGYDKTTNKLKVADPMKGITYYDRNLFEFRYKEQYSQALLVWCEN